VTEGALSLDADDVTTLVDVHQRALALDLRIERMLLMCVSLARAERIEMRVLKGPANAHRFYFDPSLRSFGDGDLLVASRDFERAIEVFGRLGFRRRFAEPRPSFDRRFTKAVTLIAEDGLELDLHRTLSPGPYGVLLDIDAVFAATPDAISIGGERLECLPPELSFVHACAHAVLGDATPRFASVRDVAQLLALDVDATNTIRTTKALGAGPLAHRAIALVERVLGTTPTGPLVEWARQQTPTRRDLRRLRCYQGGGNRYAGQAAATLWVLPSIRDRIDFVAALAFPNRSYLRSRSETYPRRVLRGASLVLGRRSQ